jgi:hypothetical protein
MAHSMRFLKLRMAVREDVGPNDSGHRFLAITPESGTMSLVDKDQEFQETAYQATHALILADVETDFVSNFEE